MSGNTKNADPLALESDWGDLVDSRSTRHFLGGLASALDITSLCVNPEDAVAERSSTVVAEHCGRLGARDLVDNVDGKYLRIATEKIGFRE
jgi:hypothetical protein